MVNDIQNKIIIVGGGLIGELLHMMLNQKVLKSTISQKTQMLKTELLRYLHPLSIG